MATLHNLCISPQTHWFCDVSMDGRRWHQDGHRKLRPLEICVSSSCLCWFASCSRSHKCICNPFFGMSMIAALAMAESIQSTQEQLPAPRCFDVLPSSKIRRLVQPHQQGSHQWHKVLVALSICRKSSSRSRLASPTMLNPGSILSRLCNPLRYHQTWGHLSQMAGNCNGLEWHLI